MGKNPNKTTGMCDVYIQMKLGLFSIPDGELLRNWNKEENKKQ